MPAKPLFLSKSARLKTKRFWQAIRSVRLGWLCTRMERQPTTDASARNTAVYSVSSKPACVPATTSAGTTAKETEAAQNTGPFPRITGSPLTAAACISRGPTLCGQSASATIPVSNPQVRRGCGYETAPARRTSTPWPISPHWRSLWPLFCPVLTPADPANSRAVLPNGAQYRFFSPS